jgi:hypothetical protein
MTNRTRIKLPAEPLTIDQIIDGYRDKWILLRVTEFDEHHEPAAGEVLCVSERHHVPWNKLGKLDREQGGRAMGAYYIFNAFPRGWTGEEWGDILKNADLSGLPRAWRQ